MKTALALSQTRSLSQRLSVEESTRNRGDTSLEHRLSLEEIPVTRLSPMKTALGCCRRQESVPETQRRGKHPQQTRFSLEHRLGLEESTRNKAVADEDSARTVADKSLSQRLSVEESTRNRGDTSLEDSV